MVDQASRLRPAGEDRVGPIQGVTDSASSVLNDAMDLAELQGRLLKADAESCLTQAKSAILGSMIAVCMMIASLPVLALGLSSLLNWAVGWPAWLCQVLVGLLLAGAGVGLGVWCLNRLRTSLESFSPTLTEASQNLRWLRQTVYKSFSMRI